MERADGPEFKQGLVLPTEPTSAIQFHSITTKSKQKTDRENKLTRLDKGQNPALRTQAIKLMMPGVCAALSS